MIHASSVWRPKLNFDLRLSVPSFDSNTPFLPLYILLTLPPVFTMQSRAPSPNNRITLNLNVSGATIDIKPGQSQQKRIRSRQSVTIEGELRVSTKCA